MRLTELVRGADAVRSGAPALEAILESLAEASPRTEFFACVYRTHPALELGLCAAVREGQVLDLTGLPEAFAQSPTFFDRWAVEADQRNRWHEYASSKASPALGRYWIVRHAHRSAPFRRIVLCQGARPLAYVSASLRNGDPWTASELQAINLRFRKISSTLRLTALAWRDRHSPESWSDRLSSEGEEALLLGTEGELLASSPGARRWLAQDPELAALLGQYGRGAPQRIYRLRHLSLRTETLEGARGARWQVLRCAQLRELPAQVPARGIGLSPRELELSEWLVSGLTNAEIAEKMGCRPSTVKTMLERLYEKHEVRGRVQLARRLTSIASDD